MREAYRHQRGMQAAEEEALTKEFEEALKKELAAAVEETKVVEDRCVTHLPRVC